MLHFLVSERDFNEIFLNPEMRKTESSRKVVENARSGKEPRCAGIPAPLRLVPLFGGTAPQSAAP